MSLSPVTLNYLTTVQPNVCGTSVKVTTTTKMVSFNYIIFPGDNANSTTYTNDLLNYTVTVGSDECHLIDTSGSTFTYSLFVTWGETLCAEDYYLVVSGLTLTGVYTPYQTTPLTLYLSPSPIFLASNSAYVTRSGVNYSDATLTVLFDISGCILYDYYNQITYNVAIQYVDGNGVLQFYTSEVNYNPNIILGKGGVQVFIDTPGTGVSEDVYVAIQTIRNVALTSSLTYKAIGEISNTVKALDTELPQPPRNLTLVSYSYQTDTANLSWLPPVSAGYINVDYFKVNRSINGGSYTTIADVSYNPLTVTYTYADTTLTLPVGTQVSYQVISHNEDGDSPPSNTVSLTVISESSAPRNLTAGGLLEYVANEGDIICAFEPPTDICGNLTCGYESAYFQLDVYDPSGSNPTQSIGSSQVPYVAGQTAYTGYVSGFPVPPGSTVRNVTLTAYLVTFGSFNGDPCYDISGQVASVSVTLTLRPFIWDINGGGVTANGLTWTRGRRVENFKVSSYLTLLDASRGRHETTTLTLTNISFTIPTPYISGSSDPLPGSYTYQFTVPSGEYTATVYAIYLNAANSSGNTARTVTGATSGP